jgi:hypothetical protein
MLTDTLDAETYPLSLPCGGFVNAYKSICNYLSIEPRGDLIWDMKNLYHVQRVKEFNFKMFELPETGTPPISFADLPAN